ncbi:MAG: diguanylate cyclase [Spirochaetaceae bacterium]
MATILVVDDEYANRYLLKHTLQEHKIIPVKNAEEMWDYLERPEALPDLILLDVMMPRESGFDAARRLADHETYRKIPIIFLSAKVAAEDVAEGLEIGGRDYVRKPFEEPELRARINSALRTTSERESLRHGATTDRLTGASRREAFLDNAQMRFQFARRKGKPFSFAFIDLDDFKNINDKCGHQVGDAVLTHAGTSVLAEMREYDLFGRYGGDEFAVALLEEEKKGALVLLERIRKRLEGSGVAAGDGEITVTVSIGVAELEEIGEESGLEDLISLADRRLYRAKELGKNRVCAD